MNCPHHCIAYRSAARSYRELPLRYAEFGTVYRYEQHGELHGLARTRGFTQDDAHIFCTPDQVAAELEGVLRLVRYVFDAFGLTQYHAQLSLRDAAKPEKYLGDAAAWEAAEQALQQACKKAGLPTTAMAGEAAFYGPKVDFMVSDALARPWQLGTVQLDYQLPERFGLTYVGADNEKHRPVMIHRAPFGSLERFIALLLEHTGGRLPLWLAPEQVRVLPLSSKYTGYGQQVCAKLLQAGLRATLDGRDEQLGRKVREAELQKVPYMVLVGEREQQAQQVALRKQGSGQQGSMPVEALVSAFLEKLKTPSYRA